MKKRKETQSRRNFLPALIFLFLISLGWAGIFFFLPPLNLLTVFAFVSLFFLTNLFLWSLLTGQTDLGLLISLFSLGFLTLARLEWLTTASFLGLLAGLVILASLRRWRQKKHFSPRRKI